MVILDSSNLITIAAGKAFVDHVLPHIAKADLVKKFATLIENGDPLTISVFDYKEGTQSALIEGRTKGLTLLPDGTPLQKVATPASLSLLSVILGPDFYVYKNYSAELDLPKENLIYDVSLMVEFSVKTVPKVHPIVAKLWPNAADVSVKNNVVVWSPPHVNKNENEFIPSGVIAETTPIEYRDTPIVDALKVCVYCTGSGKEHVILDKSAIYNPVEPCGMCYGSGEMDYAPEWFNCFPAGNRCPYRAPELPDCTLCNGSKQVRVKINKYSATTYRCPRCLGSGNC